MTALPRASGGQRRRGRAHGHRPHGTPVHPRPPPAAAAVVRNARGTAPPPVGDKEIMGEQLDNGTARDRPAGPAVHRPRPRGCETPRSATAERWRSPLTCGKHSWLPSSTSPDQALPARRMSCFPADHRVRRDPMTWAMGSWLQPPRMDVRSVSLSLHQTHIHQQAGSSEEGQRGPSTGARAPGGMRSAVLRTGLLDGDFTIVDSPELATALRKLAGRYQHALGSDEAANRLLEPRFRSGQ